MGNGKKKIPKDLIKQDINASVRANTKEIKIMGLVSNEIEANSKISKLNPYVALKYFKSDYQCFSEWQTEELKLFSSFLKSLSQYTWQQVYETGRKEPKNGFAYTSYNVDDVKSTGIKSVLKSVKTEISEDINFFELRVNQKIRVHGFQSQSIFFLVVLDRNHEAFPS